MSTEVEIITVLLYGVSTKNETFLLFVLLFKLCSTFSLRTFSQIVSEYDQEIPQSQTADNPVAPRGRAAQPSRDTRRQI